MKSQNRRRKNNKKEHHQYIGWWSTSLSPEEKEKLIYKARWDLQLEDRNEDKCIE